MKNKLMALSCWAVVFSATFSFAEDALLKKFQNPPESSRLQAWFHWNGDNVTKEGLVADLKAMGEIDIGVAHVFMPSMAHLPKTAVPLSDEWFELWDTAIKEAKKNNVKLGFHNCPGWSSSGGPWITPENSMKVVVFSEVDTEEESAKIKLEQPLTTRGFYRDIAVLAMPVSKPVAMENVSGNFDADYGKFKAGKDVLVMPLKKVGDKCSMVFEYKEPILPETMVYKLNESQIWADVVVYVSEDGNAWTKNSSFEMRMFNAQMTPKTHRLKKLDKKIKFFKVEFTAVQSPPWVATRPKKLASVTFTDLPLVSKIDSKNSSSTSFGFQPQWNQEREKGIARESFVNVTSSMSADGTLDWKAPHKGSWRILRIGYTSSGKNCAPATLPGLECDKLSRKGLDAHWPHMPKRLLEAPGAKDTVVISIVDSYEVGGQNWTEDLPKEFKARRGYDMMPYLPAIVGYTVGTVGETSKFLFDFQQTISDLFAENYYDYFTELCRKAGIKSALEPYGGPFDSIRCGSKCDVPTSEFWLGRSVKGSTRIASSIGHLYGQTSIAAEAFTTEAKEGRWQITPSQLKRYGDTGWLEGVSQLVYHSYLHQPWTNVMPGITLGRHGTQLNKNTTWWKEGIHWSRYVRRAQALLQSGKPRAEMLVFKGESSPNRHDYPLNAVLNGYNFDFCNVGALHHLKNDGKGVCMPGQRPYEILYLGTDRFLTLPTLRKLKELCDGGARIAGNKPFYSPSLSDDAKEWKRLADELWDGGKIRIANSAEEALKIFGAKQFADSKGALRAIRREIDGRDVYFVVNDTEKPFAGTVDFVAKGTPESWNAVTGEAAPLCVGSSNDAGRVAVKLDLAPHASTFVVFNPTKSTVCCNGDKKDESLFLDLSNGWTAANFQGKNAPEGTVAFDTLASWSEAKDEKLRYFAGRATYRKEFDVKLTASGSYILDLGDVKELANVTLNGKFLGCLWESPFKVDVTKALRDGRNIIEVEVVNTWPNRLIGDAIARRNGAKEPMKGSWPVWVLENKPDSGTGIYTWANWNGWKADEPLLPAGLLGPVKILHIANQVKSVN